MRQYLIPILAALAWAGPLAAQLQVPGLPPVPAPDVRGTLGDLTDRVQTEARRTERSVQREARQLLRLRDRSRERLLMRNPQAIERDANGDLARRGELLVTQAAGAALPALEAAGFRLIAREPIADLDLEVLRYAVPRGMSLADAQRLAAETAPELEASPDHLHYPASAALPAPSPAMLALAAAQPAPVGIVLPVGIIDGGSGKAVAVSAQKGFATGAPRPSDHGSAVASLLGSAGVRQVWVADVFGSDRTGGNALAIARALGWLAASGCKVITISLVGPKNAVIERALVAAQRRGVVVVAAVGNDGPAAPPAYPASYAEVLAITGVDRKGRALIEAGRALNLDYAAPGAEVYAPDAAGRIRAWRGTSFAAPLAAARLAAAMEAQGNWRMILDEEARDLGPKGPDATYGRGLLCGACGRKP